MKNFIDRMSYLCHRPAYHGKKALVLSTTGGVGVKETLKYMKMVAEALRYKVAGKRGLTTAPWPPTTNLKKKNTSALKKSARQFDKFLKSMNKNKPGKGVSFNDYLGFRIFQTISENVK